MRSVDVRILFPTMLNWNLHLLGVPIVSMKVSEETESFTAFVVHIDEKSARTNTLTSKKILRMSVVYISSRSCMWNLKIFVFLKYINNKCFSGATVYVHDIFISLSTIGVNSARLLKWLWKGYHRPAGWKVFYYQLLQKQMWIFQMGSIENRIWSCRPNRKLLLPRTISSDKKSAFMS